MGYVILIAAIALSFAAVSLRGKAWQHFADEQTKQEEEKTGKKPQP